MCHFTKWPNSWCNTCVIACARRKWPPLVRGHHWSPANTLLFNKFSVNLVDHRKHLGVTLSHDTKWHEHINSILSSAAKKLGMMRILKYSISRKSLNQIYISFLRPVLEYSAVVWDGCTLYEKESLEKYNTKRHG